MTKKSLVKYTGKDYEKYLNEKSLLELIDVLRCLDENKPYIELSKNGEVGEFLGKKYKDIPVHNVKEFYSFYESLTDRIEQLADTNESAKTYLEHANYQKELNELPSLMNKLERFSLNGLEPAFKAVMEYVYDAVMNQGFGMCNNIVDIYSVNLKKRDKKGVYLRLSPKTGCFDTTFILFKEIKKENNLGIILKELCGNGTDSELNSGEIIKRFTNFFLECDKNDGMMGILTYQIKNLLSLPKIMNKHLKKRISILESCLEEIKDK